MYVDKLCTFLENFCHAVLNYFCLLIGPCDNNIYTNFFLVTTVIDTILGHLGMLNLQKRRLNMFKHFIECSTSVFFHFFQSFPKQNKTKNKHLQSIPKESNHLFEQKRIVSLKQNGSHQYANGQNIFLISQRQNNLQRFQEEMKMGYRRQHM